jgi:hypothetical protein
VHGHGGHLAHAVPAHLRHLEAAAVGLGAARQVERRTSPGIRPRPGVSPSALWSSSICMPTHTPNSGLVAAASSTGVLQARLAQLAHAVGHGALAGQHHALGSAHLLGALGDDHVQPVPAARACTACDTERRLPMP